MIYLLAWFCASFAIGLLYAAINLIRHARIEQSNHQVADDAVQGAGDFHASGDSL